MSVDFFDLEKELQKKEYDMKCKVIRKSVSYSDDAYDGNSHADLIILEPYEGTQRDMFMKAWYNSAYPKKNGEGHEVSYVELPAFLASPISMPSLLRLSWPNEIYQKPHLMVMTVAIEHLLNTYKEVDSINIKVYPEEMAGELGVSNGVVRI